MIEVLYTCDACGVKDAKVSVRERGKKEEISKWMKLVVIAVGKDHSYKSPLCRVGTLTNVKIPIGVSGGRIGDPTVRLANASLLDDGLAPIAFNRG